MINANEIILWEGYGLGNDSLGLCHDPVDKGTTKMFCYGCWLPWMVRVEHNVGKNINAPMGRRPDKEIHQEFLNLHWDVSVSSKNIRNSTIILSNIMYRHTKLT